MIYGIGTDLVEVNRIRQALARNGDRFAEKILETSELPDFAVSSDSARFLSKRFAAKEAFGKALGTGVAVPATLHAISVIHDDLGKPLYQFSDELADFLDERGLSAHLSISDEAEYVVAFAVIEKK